MQEKYTAVSQPVRAVDFVFPFNNYHVFGGFLLKSFHISKRNLGNLICKDRYLEKRNHIIYDAERAFKPWKPMSSSVP
jgi:hypothetical protein